MTTLDDIVVRTDADLEIVWRMVMGPYPPGLRSVWMLLLDDDGRLRPVAVPMTTCRRCPILRWRTRSPRSSAA